MSRGLPVTLDGTRAPALLWLRERDLEPAALQQVRNVADLPWTHGIRLMPDAHFGKGATVGSVIAMRDAVSPSAVGVDIGCGMAAVRTSLTAADLPEDLHRLRVDIERAVPVGFRAHAGVSDVLTRGDALEDGFDRLFSRFDELHADVDDRLDRAMSQCGTLGGGNHFIEICLDQDQQVWLMLHSGSRNIGKELAERHIARARSLEWNSDLPDRDLAVFLHRDEHGRVHQEWDDYLHDLWWAQDYALLNRTAMMELVKEVVARHLPQVCFEPEIRCHHNYVAQERYDGLDLVVTRKGAISAREGQLGLIPGSMGTGSYVVRGLGNEASFCSASHGAGRRMSRNQARKRFTAADLAAQTAGVECRKDAGVVDEIPAAYKDLAQVIAAQDDLVEVVAKLDTILCVKG